MTRPTAGAGMSGFGEDGEVVPLKVGSVSGVRYWNLGGDLDEVVPLKGSYDFWQPGENTATCLRPQPSAMGLGRVRLKGKRGNIDTSVPHEGWKENCGCGFWGFWDPEGTPGGVWQVLGVIEGTGRVIRGQLGFRAAKAQITGLYLAAFDSKKERKRITKILEEHYAVPVYPSQKALLAAHPLTEEYRPPEVACQMCGTVTRSVTTNGVCQNCYYRTTGGNVAFSSGGWVSGGSGYSSGGRGSAYSYYLGPGQVVYYAGGPGGGGGGGGSYVQPSMPTVPGGGGQNIPIPTCTCPLCTTRPGLDLSVPVWQALSAAPTAYGDREIKGLVRGGYITPQQALDYLQERKKKMDEEDG